MLQGALKLHNNLKRFFAYLGRFNLFIGLVFLFVGVWVFSLWRRPVTNTEVYEKALEQLDQMKNLNRTGPDEPVPYALSADVHNDTNIGGAGFCLFMDWNKYERYTLFIAEAVIM